MRVNWQKSSHSGATGNCVEVAVHWTKSSYSRGGDANCLEVAALPQAVLLRDSMAPEAGHLAFPGPEWAAFLAAAKHRKL